MMKKRLLWKNWRTSISLLRRSKRKVFETGMSMPYFRDRKISEVELGAE